MNPSRIWPVALLAATASAQDTTPPTPSPVDVGAATHAAHGLWLEDDRLCGGGPDYRIEARPDAFRFVPAVPSSPTALGLDLRLRDVRRGERVLARGGPAAPESDGSTVVYRREAGIEERYELRADGVEQSFVVPSRPAGSGDLRVSLRVDSDLQARREGDVSDGVRFAFADRDAVTIGRAVAFDATGRRWPMRMRFSAGTLELALPGSAVEAASYPLVLDPPIGASYTASGSTPAVAFDSVHRRYLVVWHTQLSGDTGEIRAQRLAETGDLVGPVVRIASGAGTRRANPTAATVGGSDRFCVVWQSSFSALGPWELRCRLMSSETAALSNTVAVAPTLVSSDSAPDLGSEASTADEEVVLVWERSGRGVMAAQITVPPTGDPNAFGETRLAGGRRPRISQSGGSSGTYVVAYESGAGVRAIPIDRNLAVLGSSLSMTGTESRTDVDVDGDGQDFVVVYQREESVGAGSHDVIGRALRWDGTQLTATTAELPIAAEPGRDERDPAVGWLGSVVLTAWSRATGELFDYELRMRTFTGELRPCGQVHDLSSTLDVIDAAPAIATQLASGGAPRQAVIAFSRFSAQSRRLDVRTQRFAGLGGGPTRTLSPACGVGGTVAANGPFAIGNLDLRIELTGADPDAIAAFFLFGVEAPILPCQLCAITRHLVLLPVPIANGAAAVDLPIDCSRGGLVGQSFEMQFVTLGTAATPCTIAPGLSASNRLLATLDY